MAEHQPSVDDPTLIADALRGDEEALGRLLTRDQEWAYNVAYRVLGEEAAARDAVQDAFLQTVRALRGEGSPPHTPDSFRPWLRRVVVNSALTQVRRRPPVRSVSVEDVAESVPGPEHAEPGGTAEREETRQQVLQVLLALPRTQRVALALKEYLGASYEEIAETLEIPRTAVGTLLFRARTAFRDAYDRLSETSPPVNCPDLVPLFSTIVDEESRPPAWEALEEHLRACEHCQTKLESQRRARRLYALIPLAALPAGWDPVKAALGGAAAGAGPAAAAGSVTPAAGPEAGAASAGSAVSGASSSAASLSAGAASASPASGAGPASHAAGASAGLAAGSPAAAAATPAAVTPATAASPAAVGVAGAGAAAAGTAAATAGGGLLAGASAAKLAVAALAAAGVIGATVVAAPFVRTGPDAAASPSPVVGIVASPSPGSVVSASPAASPVGASPPALAGTAAASPSPAIGPIIFPTASPAPGAEPGTPTPATGTASATPAPTPSPATSPTAQP